MKIKYYFDFSKDRAIKNTYGEDEHVDLSQLTLIERLFISAYLTKITTGTELTLGEIIFGADGSNSITLHNYDELDRTISDILKSKVQLLHWIHDEVKKKQTDPKYKPSIFWKEIDSAKIFALRPGRVGQNLSNIAWRACALAIDSSTYRYKNDLTSLNIFQYLYADKTLDEIKAWRHTDPKKFETLYRNQSNLIERIKKWLDLAGICGSFKNKEFHFETAKDAQERLQKSMEKTSSERQDPVPETIIQKKDDKDKQKQAFEVKSSSSVSWPKDSVQLKLQTLLDMDPVKFDSKLEKLEESFSDRRKALVKINDNIFSYAEKGLKKICKAFGVSERGALVDKFKNGSFLKIEGSFNELAENIKSLAQEIYPMLSDDEDDRVFDDELMRELARMKFVEYYGWMMKVN